MAEDRTSRPPADASTSPIKERLREAALRLGFASVGFAAAEPHEHGGRVAAWVAEGRHGTMRWMARDPARRGDPARLLPGARTVISVAASYYRPGPAAAATTAGGPEALSPPESATPRGVIARYA
jgi:epoxyqueuosine reductase QueG